jgi:hypothetical protein
MGIPVEVQSLAYGACGPLKNKCGANNNSNQMPHIHESPVSTDREGGRAYVRRLDHRLPNVPYKVPEVVQVPT